MTSSQALAPVRGHALSQGWELSRVKCGCVVWCVWVGVCVWGGGGGCGGVGGGGGGGGGGGEGGGGGGGGDIWAGLYMVWSVCLEEKSVSRVLQ